MSAQTRAWTLISAGLAAREMLIGISCSEQGSGAADIPGGCGEGAVPSWRAGGISVGSGLWLLMAEGTGWGDPARGCGVALAAEQAVCVRGCGVHLHFLGPAKELSRS